MDWTAKSSRGDLEPSKEDLSIGKNTEARERKWKKENFDPRMRLSVEGNIYCSKGGPFLSQGRTLGPEQAHLWPSEALCGAGCRRAVPGKVAEGECWLWKEAKSSTDITSSYSEKQKIELIGEPTSWKAPSGEGGTHLACGSGRVEFVLLPVRHSYPKLHPHLKMSKYPVSSPTYKKGSVHLSFILIFIMLQESEGGDISNKKRTI